MSKLLVYVACATSLGLLTYGLWCLVQAPVAGDLTQALAGIASGQMLLLGTASLSLFKRVKALEGGRAPEGLPEQQL
ncbi:MAG: hypothetical protein KIT17_01035 [Rubrivivax sp.]|nr:hypothetical protein [Rubrivivax sp.]